jgi:hypothetical protein
MSTMQAFYNKVICSDKLSNPYMDSLLRLTRISIDKLTVFKSEINRNMWGE